ncbi:hypothetical protein LWI29_016554 [Acer saccharum]|uniref:Uncharacterized protein n=1 Tax=Acer saccharum TaxID=4024 RepID=A0AA39RX17_ACESA|nr:hypothetical protein LWI29_016554 [Acer saccharum]
MVAGKGMKEDFIFGSWMRGFPQNRKMGSWGRKWEPRGGYGSNLIISNKENGGYGNQIDRMAGFDVGNRKTGAGLVDAYGTGKGANLESSMFSKGVNADFEQGKISKSGGLVEDMSNPKIKEKSDNNCLVFKGEREMVMVKENVDQVSVGLGNGPTSFEAAGATHSTLDVYASDPRLGLPVDITQDVMNVGLSQPISFEAKISQINLGNSTLIGKWKRRAHNHQKAL